MLVREQPWDECRFGESATDVEVQHEVQFGFDSNLWRSLEVASVLRGGTISGAY